MSKHLDLQRKLFYILGCDFSSGQITHLRIATMVCILFLNSLLALTGAVHFKHLAMSERSAGIISALTSSLGAFKLMAVGLRSSIMTELWQNVDDNEPKMEQFVVEKRAKVISNLFLIASAGVVLAWTIRPFLTMTKTLAFPYWFPFPTDQDVLYFLLGHFTAFVFLCVIGVTLCAIDTTIVIATSRICVRLVKLKKGWQKINFRDNSEGFYSQIRQFFNSHVEILSLIHNLERITSFLFFIQVIECTMISCMTVFAVTQVENPIKEIPKYLPIIIGGYSMFFMYCWAGEEVKTHASDLQFVIYSANWSHSNNSKKKLVLMGMTFTGQPVSLRGAYIFPMQLRTFMHAVRESFSYFMVLHSLTTQ